MKFRAGYRCHSIPQCIAPINTRNTCFYNMAYIRNTLWKEDDILKSDLKSM